MRRLLPVLLLVPVLAACSSKTIVAPACSDPSSCSGEVSVGVDDAGSTVQLHVGQTLTVTLTSAHVPVTTTSSSVTGSPDDAGGYDTGSPSTATLVMAGTGTARVSSTTDTPCRHLTPPCNIAQVAWSVKVVVS